MRSTLTWGTALSVILLLVLAGCGGGQDGGGPSGEIVLYTSEPQENADETVAAFNEHYPEIAVQVFRSGTGELLTKIEAEESAGGVQADVLLAADAPTFESLKSRDSSPSTSRKELGRSPRTSRTRTASTPGHA
jgi:iron(III) transport system substrate-binding protein